MESSGMLLRVSVADSRGGPGRRDEWAFTAAAGHTHGHEIVPCAGKGLGVRALRAFTAGDVIFAERPLVRWFQDVNLSKEKNLVRLTDSVARLSAASASAFFALTQDCELYGQKKTPLGIFLSNAHPTVDGAADSSASLLCSRPDTVSAAAYAHFSRFNHACNPNTSHSWQSDCGAVQ